MSIIVVGGKIYYYKKAVIWWKIADAFFCDLNIFSWEILPLPPQKKPFFRTPKTSFFFKKNFFKENFQIFCMNFLWQISSTSRQIWGTYARGGTFCSKKLPLFFDRSGVRMPGIFCSKELPLFFWQIWGTYAGGFLFKGIAFGF